MSLHKKKEHPIGCSFFLFAFLAEREGFEPPVPLSTTVFKTVVIDHSTISPNVENDGFWFQKRCKGNIFFWNVQIFVEFFYSNWQFFLSR